MASLREIPVQAIAIAGTLNPKDALPVFDGVAKKEKLTKTVLLLRYSDGGYAVLHDFGAMVFFDVEPGEMDRVIKGVLARLDPEPRSPIRERYAVFIEEGATPRVEFNGVVLPALTNASVELLSLVLGQSVA